MVECYLGVDPGVILLETFPLIVNNTDWQPGVVLVNTLVELSTKKLNSHDGEYQPEDQAHQQDIDDGGDGVHQGIYYNLDQTVKVMLYHSFFNFKKMCGICFRKLYGTASKKSSGIFRTFHSYFFYYLEAKKYSPLSVGFFLFKIFH